VTAGRQRAGFNIILRPITHPAGPMRWDVRD